MSSHSDSALLILGHGSTQNPDSSRPCWQHADSIRERGIFRNVYCAFWKEEPSLRQVWPMIEEENVYVVPNFISEGYFTTEVIPRELELDGPITHKARHNIYYCDPVGSHEAMARLLIDRANHALGPEFPLEETSLIIVGHGTGLNARSTEAIHSRVSEIRQLDIGFAEVLPAFMEEAPFVAEWQSISSGKYVVVVPFFVADGLHSYQDIPVMLGIESAPSPAASRREVFRNNPTKFDDRALFYTEAIGTAPGIADIIIEQVRSFDLNHPT